MSGSRFTRRALLRAALLGTAGLAATACQPKIVEVTREVEKVVKETLVVEKEKIVEKEKMVEKEVTRVVEAKPSTERTVIRYHTRAAGIKPPDDQFPIHQNRLSEFRMEHPEIEVVIEGIAISSLNEYYVKLATMVAAQTAGDMTWDHQSDCDHQRLGFEGVLAPINEFMERDAVKEDEWWPAAMENAKFEGKLYGLPMCAHPGGTAFLYYNEDMWADAGVKMPENDGYTLDDLREAALKLSQGQPDQREVYGFLPGFGGSQNHECYMRAFGAYSFVDETGKKTLMNSPAAMGWATFGYALYNEDKVAPKPEALPSGGTYAMFDAQKLSAFQSGSWAYKTVRSVVGTKFKIGSVLYPEGPAGRGSGNYLDCFALLSQLATGHPVRNEAWMLLRAFTDERAGFLQLSLSGQLCARPDAFEKLKDDVNVGSMVRLFRRSIGESKPQFKLDNFRGAEHATTVNNHMSKIWLGEQKSEQPYLETLAGTLQAILDKPR